MFFMLCRNKKVAKHIRQKTYKSIVLRFRVQDDIKFLYEFDSCSLL